MANPSYTAITQAGTIDYWADISQSPFNLAYAVEFAPSVGGSYRVSYTLDDPNDPSWAPVYLADTLNGAATTVSASGSYVTPIRGLRVVTSTITGASTVFGAGPPARLAVIQGNSAR